MAAAKEKSHCSKAQVQASKLYPKERSASAAEASSRRLAELSETGSRSFISCKISVVTRDDKLDQSVLPALFWAEGLDLV